MTAPGSMVLRGTGWQPLLAATARDVSTESLRAVAQGIFAGRMVSGAAALTALWLASPWRGVTATVGVLVATIVARVMRLDRMAGRTGVLGYHGLLLGAALPALYGPAWSLPLLIAVIVGATISAPLAVGTRSLLRPLPVLTVPFNLIAIAVVATLPRMSGVSVPIDAVALSPTEPDLMSVGGAIETMIRGVGQTIFVDAVAGGLLVLLAIACWSRRAAILALIASAIGATTGALLGADATAIHAGLWGFNAVLVCLFVVGRRPTALLALGGLAAAICTTLLLATITVPMTGLGLPTLTVPFCIAGLVIAAGLRSNTPDRPAGFGSSAA